MAFVQTTDVIVFAASRPDALLQQVAEHRGWPVVNVNHCRDALPHLRTMRPHAAIVEMNSDVGLQRSLRLMELLRRRGGRLSLLAWTALHSDEHERAARCAGASAYGAGEDGLALFDQILSSPPVGTGSARTTPKSARDRSAGPVTKQTN